MTKKNALQQLIAEISDAIYPDGYLAYFRSLQKANRDASQEMVRIRQHLQHKPVAEVKHLQNEIHRLLALSNVQLVHDPPTRDEYRAWRVALQNEKLFSPTEYQKLRAAQVIIDEFLANQD